MGPSLPLPPSKQRLSPFVVTAPSLGAYRNPSLRACPMTSDLLHQRGPKQALEELGWQRDPSSVPLYSLPLPPRKPPGLPSPTLCQPLPILGAQNIKNPKGPGPSFLPAVPVGGVLSLPPAWGPSSLGPHPHRPWMPGLLGPQEAGAADGGTCLPRPWLPDTWWRGSRRWAPPPEALSQASVSGPQDAVEDRLDTELWPFVSAPAPTPSSQAAVR